MGNMNQNRLMQVEPENIKTTEVGTSAERGINNITFIHNQ